MKKLFLASFGSHTDAFLYFTSRAEGKEGRGPAGVDERVGASKGGDDVLQLFLGFWGLGGRNLAWERGGEGGGR